MRTHQKMAGYAVLVAIAILIAGMSPAWATQKQQMDRQDDLAVVGCTATQQKNDATAHPDDLAASQQKQNVIFKDMVPTVTIKTQRKGSGNGGGGGVMPNIGAAIDPNTATDDFGIARIGHDDWTIHNDGAAMATWNIGGAIPASSVASPSSMVVASSGIMFGPTIQNTEPFIPAGLKTD